MFEENLFNHLTEKAVSALVFMNPRIMHPKVFAVWLVKTGLADLPVFDIGDDFAVGIVEFRYQALISVMVMDDAETPP
jgi:hypothetical protein